MNRISEIRHVRSHKRELCDNFGEMIAEKYEKPNWQLEWIGHSLVHLMPDQTQRDNCTNVTTEIVNGPAFRLHIASSTFDCARTHPYNYTERTHANDHTQPQTQYASARAMRHFTSLHTHSPTNIFCTNTSHSDRPEINRNEHSAAIRDNAISPNTKEWSECWLPGFGVNPWIYFHVLNLSIGMRTIERFAKRVKNTVSDTALSRDLSWAAKIPNYYN